jgi:hypothetical protein
MESENTPRSHNTDRNTFFIFQTTFLDKRVSPPLSHRQYPITNVRSFGSLSSCFYHRLPACSCCHIALTYYQHTAIHLITTQDSSRYVLSSFPPEIQSISCLSIRTTRLTQLYLLGPNIKLHINKEVPCDVVNTISPATSFLLDEKTTAYSKLCFHTLP